jgi:hypothetical protein
MPLPEGGKNPLLGQGKSAAEIVGKVCPQAATSVLPVLPKMPDLTFAEPGMAICDFFKSP